MPEETIQIRDLQRALEQLLSDRGQYGCAVDSERTAALQFVKDYLDAEVLEGARTPGDELTRETLVGLVNKVSDRFIPSAEDGIQSAVPDEIAAALWDATRAEPFPEMAVALDSLHATPTIGATDPLTFSQTHTLTSEVTPSISLPDQLGYFTDCKVLEDAPPTLVERVTAPLPTQDEVLAYIIPEDVGKFMTERVEVPSLALQPAPVCAEIAPHRVADAIRKGADFFYTYLPESNIQAMATGALYGLAAHLPHVPLLGQYVPEWVAGELQQTAKAIEPYIMDNVKQDTTAPLYWAADTLQWMTDQAQQAPHAVSQAIRSTVSSVEQHVPTPVWNTLAAMGFLDRLGVAADLVESFSPMVCPVVQGGAQQGKTR
jgi:hypothetical protein